MYRDQWKYDDDVCSPDELATKYNMWLRLDKKWYTPKEFRDQFYGRNPLRFKGVEIINPLWALKQAREMLDKAVMEESPSTVVLLFIDKIFDFLDKIITSGFRTAPGQMDSIPWPLPKRNPNAIPFKPKEKPAEDQGEKMNA